MTVNLLKSVRYFTYHQVFDIKKFYMVLTLRLCVLYGVLPCATLTDWFFITQVESVYSAVRTEYLYNTENFRI
jgi:hypothetical protein